jgi:hypothetical protein
MVGATTPASIAANMRAPDVERDFGVPRSLCTTLIGCKHHRQSAGWVLILATLRLSSARLAASGRNERRTSSSSYVSDSSFLCSGITHQKPNLPPYKNLYEDPTFPDSTARTQYISFRHGRSPRRILKPCKDEQALILSFPCWPMQNSGDRPVASSPREYEGTEVGV